MDPSLPPVRMVDLAARHAGVAAAVEQAVLDVLRSGRWVGGPEVEACEAEVATLFGRRHGVGVNSGTDALLLALKALGVGPGDEVIVPALSFFATAEAVLLAGATPVVVDVCEARPLMDPVAAGAAWSSRTRAAIPVHLFGMACPDPGLPVPLVEDSAQAAGQEPPPRLGTLTAVSFYPTKTLCAAGDGGLLATDDPDLARAVRRLAGHGAVEGTAHLHERVAGHPGTNSRLDAVQAAVVRRHLADLPRRVQRRREVAARYDAALPPGARAVPRDPGDPLHHHVLRSRHRDALAAHLRAWGIETAVYYPRPLSAQPAVGGTGPLPRAEAWCREILSLPCHEALTDHDVLRVVQALEAFQP